jgi:transposase
MSTIQRAYKTELDLNNVQTTACRRHAGAARWAYNWGLARKQEAYRATGTTPSAMDLHRELNALKQTTVLWLYDRVFRCQNPECGLALDRDLNAALNLAKLAGSSSESPTACGEESAGQSRVALVKLSPLKQEPDPFDASA